MFMSGMKKEIQRNWQLYVLLLFPFAFLIIFNYIPMYGIQLAFKRFIPGQGIWGGEWVGFDNFIRFWNTFYFQRVLANTLKIGFLSLLAGFPFSILLALMLNASQYHRFKKSVQMITYAPYFISTVVMVGMIYQLLSTRFGLFNNFFAAIGLDRISFFINENYFTGVYIWSGIWQGAGWGSVIYIAALAGVDSQLHEAAIVDGASLFKRILHIDIPGIAPTIIITLILNTGSILNVGFEKIYLMQNDQNLAVSEVISTYVYKVGLFNTIPDYSYSTAIGLFNSVVCFILIMFVNSVSKRVSDTSLW